MSVLRRIGRLPFAWVHQIGHESQIADLPSAVLY